MKPSAAAFRTARRRILAGGLLCAAGLWPTAGTAPARAQPAPTLPRLDAPLLLLGEVHDNAVQHALRLQALQAVVDRGARPALLMEMFDRERQGAIDAVLQAPADGDAAAPQRIDALIDAGGRQGGWHWPFYRPYLALALQYRLPVVAANVSRSEARRIIQLGLQPTGYQPDVPADIQRAQTAAIEQSHCGAIDAGMALRLADAQVARDQFMARAIVAQAGRGVVLLAGNGHVRRDIGVPRWLPADLRRRSHVVGYLEAGDGDVDAYDEVIVTAVQARPDPCASMPARPAGSAASR